MRAHIYIYALVCVAALLLTAPSSPAQEQPLALVTGGMVRGTVLPDGTRLFRGLPYAQPPVGAWRWKPPQPVQPWSGVREAGQPGPPCYQRSYGWNQADATASREDCLYLDVRTPSLDYTAKLPVMVLIHGGANRAGSGSGFVQSDIPRHGVVLVTLQYRLGIFGFLSLKSLSIESGHHASGNYALLDQIAALRWVHDNIAKFGGDPNNVTLFGHSAGSQDTGLLTLSPLARGLFVKTIEQSGTAGFGVAPRTLAENESIGAQLEDKLGIVPGPSELDALRAVPADKLLDATDTLTAPGLEDQSFIWLAATVDGTVLPRNPAVLLNVRAEARVSAIIGNSAQELALYGGAGNVQHWLGKYFGRRVAAASRLYDRETPDPVLGDVPVQLATDTIFRCPGNRVADAYRSAGRRVWRYQLDLAAPGTPGPSSHGSELPYVFNAPPAGATDATWPPFQAYWVNFARSGDPNGPGLPRWPDWSRGRSALVFTASGPRAVQHYRAGICSMLRNP